MIVQEMRQEDEVLDDLSGHTGCMEVKLCKVCGTTVGAKCCKDHQKADWKAHKKACVPREDQQTRRAWR